jgi:DNA-binding MarR family transcriptional regulator
MTAEDRLIDFNYQLLDKTINARIRFAALAYLQSVEKATFVEIRERINATDGNLSVHMRKLESAGYISCDKGFQLRKPQTSYSITNEGLNAFRKYRESLGKFFEPPFTVHPV